MLWQKADAVAASSGAAVFDSAKGFVAAWHMGGAPGNRANSTPGGIPAVPATTVVDTVFAGRSTTGLIGLADTLRGGPAAGGEYFNVSPMPGFGTGFTFSFWVNISSTTGRAWMRFFDFGNGEGQDNLFAGRNASTTTVRWDVFPGQFVDAANTLVLNQWKHYTMTVGAIDNLNGQPSPTEMFVDGVSVGTNTGNFLDVERAASYLGRSNWAADTYFTGKMDEVHISKVARRAGWAKLSFETQKPGANLLVFGATGAPVSVASPAHTGARPLMVTAQGRGYAFTLPVASGAPNGAMRLIVLDMHGRTVWSSVMDQGASTLAWNGIAANGQPLARGMYFARLVPVSGAQTAAVWETRFAHTR
jgi:hypothetical protein